jgi:hypothetical protein
MSLVRKSFTVAEDLLSELGEPVQNPFRRAAAAAVITNPWAGAGPRADLSAAVCRIGPLLARDLSARLMTVLGGAERIAAFGKAAIVGLDGEMEHGAALIHTPYFGNIFRELVEGTSVIVFSDDRGPAGTPLTVPLWHKTASTTRSHYLTVPFRVPDAPCEDEIVVIAAAATGPRPNARIGDRTTDPAVHLSDLERMP